MRLIPQLGHRWSGLAKGRGGIHADAVTGDTFVDALTMSNISYDPGGFQPHEIVVDDRFLVSKPAAHDGHADHDLTFDDRFDVTNQIVAVKMMLDRRVVAIDHES